MYKNNLKGTNHELTKQPKKIPGILQIQERTKPKDNKSLQNRPYPISSLHIRKCLAKRKNRRLHNTITQKI